MSSGRHARRRRTRRWLLFYVGVLVLVAGVTIWQQQWSVALSTLGVAAAFLLLLRLVWRRG
jgi:hypothetical protein